MNTPKKIQHVLKIPASSFGQRLDHVLPKLLPDYSRTQIQTWIDQGHILLDEQIVKAKTKVKGGETVNIDAPVSILVHEAQPITFPIIYEDESLLIINKPPGLVVHPGAGQKDQTLLNALLFYLPVLNTLPRAGILHRLDKNTSGLLLIAKTPQALKALSAQLKNRTLLREYQAVVYGQLISGGTVDVPIGRHPIKRQRMAAIEKGKPARTHYRVLEKYRAHTLIKAILDTGRTHQIRVHMAHIHHPIVGDSHYGRLQLTKGMDNHLIEFLRNFKRQALHAYAIGFLHPIKETWMSFEIDVPKDMHELIQLLRDDEKQRPNLHKT